MIELCIVGAPRCGTSSLFKWLTAHPEVNGPKDEKELFFFMDENHPLIGKPNIHATSLEEYNTLFPSDVETCAIEGTTHYLFQETARLNLAKMDSEPFIVALLRDPAQRVRSSFQYTRNNLANMDMSLSFRQYVEWGLKGDRDSIKAHISHPGSAYVLSRDIEYGRYIKYLLPWREAVGRGRLIVLSFTDMISDPRATCRRLASLLDVDADFYADFEFETHNTTYDTSSRLLHSLARSIGKRVPESRAKRLVKQIYMAVATSEGSTRPKEAGQALRRLKEHYLPYNERLAEEFDVDISSWT